MFGKFSKKKRAFFVSEKKTTLPGYFLKFFRKQLFCRKVSNSTTKSQTVLQNQNDAILSMFQITFTDASLDFSYSSFFKIMIFSNRFSQWSLSVISPQSGLPEYWKSEIVLIYIWRQGRVRNAKFGTNASNEKLLNAAKCQGHSFYRFCVIKRKPTG